MKVFDHKFSQLSITSTDLQGKIMTFVGCFFLRYCKMFLRLQRINNVSKFSSYKASFHRVIIFNVYQRLAETKQANTFSRKLSPVPENRVSNGIQDCMKSVLIQSYSGPYSARMQQNTDQNNSEYGHFLRSATK